MDGWEIDAREGARDLIGAYTHAGDRRRLHELAALFGNDGVLETHGMWSVTGAYAIASKLAESAGRRRPQLVRHNVSSIWFGSVQPGEIHAESYFTVYTDLGPDHWGRYRDRIVGSGTTWHFAHRLVRIDSAAENSYIKWPLPESDGE